MRTSSFNAGWTARPKPDRFFDRLGVPAEAVPVTLPHDSVIGLPRDPEHPAATGYFPGGAFEYNKTFDVPADWEHQRVWLRFEGIYRNALVYVNGDIAASQPYGYSEIAFALDPFVRFGESNTIEVHARSHLDSRWYSGAGIYRDVTLFVGGPVHVPIDGVTVTTPEISDDGALVVVDTEVVNQSPHTRTTVVSTSLVAADGTVVGANRSPVTTRPGSTGILRQRIFVDSVDLWSTDRPAMYECRTALLEGDDEIDAVDTSFGVRSLALDPRHGLRLNGEPVKLRGACIHHDNGPLGAATIGRAEERRVEILKAAGFNALRSAHNPASRALLDACDRFGMLVMDEAFDMWAVTKTDYDNAVNFLDRWPTDVEAMVRKDRNHPSVVLYSIGNEIPETTNRLGAVVGREIAERFRALDPTRFTTNSVSPMMAFPDDLAAAPGPSAEGGFVEPPPPWGSSGSLVESANSLLAIMKERIDPLMEKPIVAERTEETYASVDVAGYNYMFRRYDTDCELFPDRVIVGSETHPRDIDLYWALVEAHPQVIGDFTWTGWDYIGEVGIGRVDYFDEDHDPMAPFLLAAPFPWMLASCGDIDILGHRRPVSYYREIVFGLRTEPYVSVQRPEHHDDEIAFIGSWSWSDSISSWSWTGHEGRPVRIEVYSASDEVELLVNGDSVGRQPAGPAHRFMTVFETQYEPGEVVAVAYTDGLETGRSSLHSALGEVVLAASADRGEIRADDTDLAYVAVSLVDSEGNLHNTADRPVSVSVEGVGVLQAFGSAQPDSTESFSDTTRTTFDGRALAIIRPTGPGAITVTVEADGCDTVTVQVEAANVQC